MDAADSVLWKYADEHGVAPMAGANETPAHIRRDIGRWLRRQALPCPHSIALALEGVFFRVVGRADVWCPSCASVAGVVDMVTTCARCAGAVADDGHRSASSIGHAVIFGAWCSECWRREDEG